jgi:hypothetical protein
MPRETNATDEPTIQLFATEYSFSVQDNRVKVDVSGLRPREAEEDHPDDSPREVLVTIEADASEKEITDALELIISNIKTNHLQSRSRRIEKSEAGAMLMWDATNSVLEAANAIVWIRKMVEEEN